MLLWRIGENYRSITVSPNTHFIRSTETYRNCTPENTKVSARLERSTCLLLQLLHAAGQMSRDMTKPTKWHVCPAKTQISLGIRSVWSKSSLSAWRKHGSLATHLDHSEDSDQTGRMPRLIWVYAGHTCHFVGFVMRRLMCLLFMLQDK